MVFKDIEYQDRAVNRLNDLLDDAWDDYRSTLEMVSAGRRSEPRRQAVYLSALTGSGKTIMVGRLLARLLDQPDTVILWLSDSPSLNLQTKGKLEDLIDPNRLVVIERISSNERMEPGYVYFLNPQKLSKRDEDTKGGQETVARWRFLKAALNDKSIRLYIVQDEAHRGINKTNSNGEDKIITSIVEATNEYLSGADPVPVILGLSATPKRFEEAMESSGRKLKGHDVERKAIQESGLVKRDIDFHTPNEAGANQKGNREAQLGMLEEAVETLKASDDAWAAFHQQETTKGGYTEQRVVPLLLFQVQDSISGEELGEWVRHVNDAWDRHFGHGLPPGAVAHVLQGGADIKAGDYDLPYCPPQEVQGRTDIRVLIAKLAVSTGWDCPRAEVLYSLRGGNDETYVAQLIGRMVRMPLAQRSLTRKLDALNVVRVLLPYFAGPTVERVVKGVREGSIPGKTQVDMVDLERNSAIVEEHDDAPYRLISSLTKAPAPTGSANPIDLMNRLAVMIAHDHVPGVEPDPDKNSRKALFDLFDGYATTHSEDIKTAEKALGYRSETRSRAQNWVISDQLTTTTERVALSATGRAAKIDRLIESLPGGLGGTYVKYLKETGTSLSAARERAASIAQLESAVMAAQDAARAQCREWLDLVCDYLDEDEAKPPEAQCVLESRRIEYRKRIAQFGDPIPTKVGEFGPAQVSFGPADNRFRFAWKKNLFTEVDGDKLYRLDVSESSWEKRVLDIETGRESVIGWYRNPGAGGEFTLQLPWKDGATWRSAHPDFVFVEMVGAEVMPSVVDPHDPDRDGLARLRGLAEFIATYGSEYHRFWSVGNSGSGSTSLLYLDLMDQAVQSAILAEGADLHEVYRQRGHAYQA